MKNPLLVSIVALVVFVSFFWAGFHNLDSAQNARYLETAPDIELIDKTGAFIPFTTEQGYIIGMDILFIAFAFSLVSAFYLGRNIQKLEK